MYVGSLQPQKHSVVLSWFSISFPQTAMFLTRPLLSIIHLSLALLSLLHLANPSIIHLSSSIFARLPNPYPLPSGDRFLDFYAAGNPIPPP